MSFINICEDRRDLFPPKIGIRAGPITSRSISFAAGQVKIIEVHNGTTKIAPTLNYMYDDNTGYVRTLLSHKIAHREEIGSEWIRIE